MHNKFIFVVLGSGLCAFITACGGGGTTSLSDSVASNNNPVFATSGSFTSSTVSQAASDAFLSGFARAVAEGYVPLNTKLPVLLSRQMIPGEISLTAASDKSFASPQSLVLSASWLPLGSKEFSSCGLGQELVTTTSHLSCNASDGDSVIFNDYYGPRNGKFSSANVSSQIWPLLKTDQADPVAAGNPSSPINYDGYFSATVGDGSIIAKDSDGNVYFNKIGINCESQFGLNTSTGVLSSTGPVNCSRADDELQRKAEVVFKPMTFKLSLLEGSQANQQSVSFSGSGLLQNGRDSSKYPLVNFNFSATNVLGAIQGKGAQVIDIFGTGNNGEFTLTLRKKGTSS